MKEYFSHDYNGRNDRKLVKLRMDFGLEGIGIYWCIVEMLYENNGRICLDEIETIAFELQTDCERITTVLKNYDLFRFKGNFFYSESVNGRLNKRKEKSDKARTSALTRWNTNDKDDANALQTHNEGNAIKVNKSKVNKSKIKVTPDKPVKHDIILDLIVQFQESYKEANGDDYDLITEGKDRAAMSKLLVLYKKKNPGQNTEQTLNGFRHFFDLCNNIKDDWLRRNMSPAIIMSKLNEIKNTLRNGNQRTSSKGGATDRELAELFARKLGIEQ
jgi:hypothetical protein